MTEGQEKESLAADLALITAAQKVEHYENFWLRHRPEALRSGELWTNHRR